MSNADSFLETAANGKYNSSARSSERIKIFTLDGGVEKELPGFRITSEKTTNGKIMSVSLVDGSSVSKAKLDRTQINEFHNFFGATYSYGSKYRKVIDNELWQGVYNVDLYHSFTGYDSRNGAPRKKIEAAVACRKCFIILPTRIITIDHQAPQTGGTKLAILRIFRGLGLTAGGPRLNGKNYKSIQLTASKVGGDPAPVMARPKTEPLKTLNDAGTLYYSVLKANDEGWLGKACLHHYLNLRPMCGPCNSSLSNKNIW